MSGLVNIDNFLRWNNVNNLGPADTTSEPTNGYIQNAGQCDYGPVIKHAEAMRFYINSITGTYWIVDTNVKLKLINAVTGVVQNANVATLQVDSFTNPAGNPSFNYYSEVTIADTCPPGKYYFRIQGDAHVWMESNSVLIVAVTDDANLRGTALLNYRHDRYWYGIRYNALTTFTHQYRLHVNQVSGPDEESTVDLYKEVTTGVRREYNISLDQLFGFETADFDKMAHSAAIVMFKSSNLLINGRPFMAKDAYRSIQNPREKFTKGNITLYDNTFATVNHCTP